MLKPLYSITMDSTYGGYETGYRGIPSEVWFKLADFHNTSVDYLMGRTDEKRPYPPAQALAGRGPGIINHFLLQIKQRQRQIHRHYMGVYKAAMLLPQAVLLVIAIFAYFHKGG